MTPEEALKRGAEAGWALAEALRETCPINYEIALRAAAEAIKQNLEGKIR
jgi:hypothetical protein